MNEPGAARVDGRATSLDGALAAAAELLARARRPLVHGLARATVEAQRAAVELAELLGAVIDPAGSAAHAASTAALQRIGQVTATLGEARARADLLVFWGIDPDRVHPGFSQSYLMPAPPAPGVPGATSRATLAVDVGRARGPETADERLQVDPEGELELLWAARASLKGRRLEPPPGTAPAGWSAEPARALAARLGASRYGILFYEAEPPPERRDPLRPLALGALAMDANPGARLRLIGVRPPGNSAGAEAVLTWQTGFPSAVDFSRGYPRYGPGEYDAEHVLAAGEADVVLRIGPAGELSAAARAGLARLPAVVLDGGEPAADGPVAAGGDVARVTIVTLAEARTPGSVYRMDGVPLRRRLDPPAPSADAPPTDEQVLRRLLEAVRARRRAVHP